ncbi:MAG: GNAT family N-acetyltransferase [Defluviitaleaceae bacterium]|nr:GNAT family N-acetyltransferase [Defluviitaleaceae bacterium]
MANIVPMTKEYARLISLWKYEGKYSFYNQSEGNIEGYMDGTHFSYTNEDGKLIGYFCFGKEARIPTVEEDIYDDDFLDIGLGLRPDMCGRQIGLAFFNDGLDYAQRVFNTKKFRLSVAVFNERAIKVYIKAGFCVTQEVTNSYFKNKFFIMNCIR